MMKSLLRQECSILISEKITNHLHRLMAHMKQLASKIRLYLNFPNGLHSIPSINLPSSAHNKDIESDEKSSNSDNSRRSRHDNYHYSVEDEAKRLKKEIEITIEEVRESKFYRDLIFQLQGNSGLVKHIWRVLKYDQSQQMQMVIYCLGSLEFNFRSQYQLALAILLKKELSDKMGCGDIDMEAFDPVFSPADRIVLEELGVKVLTHNEHCRRRVLRPTLFVMPCYYFKCMENLLEENWQPCHLNKMILLTNSLKFRLARLARMEERDDDHDIDIFQMSYYSKAIFEKISEFLLPMHCPSFWDIFQDFAWHFFDLDPQLNLDTLLPVQPSKEERLRAAKEDDAEKDLVEYDLKKRLRQIEKIFMRPFETKKQNANPEDPMEESTLDWSSHYFEHRGPRWVRICSLPPQPGWHKLNITGIGHGFHDNNNKKKCAYLGGVLANDKGEVVAKYSGNLGCNRDKVVAIGEALNIGAMLVSKKFPEVTKLIVEGNDVSFIRWMNKGPEPPIRIQKHLANVSDHWLKEIETVVYHVYEEANSLAIEMASEGSKVGVHQAWIYTKTGGKEILVLE